jgi:hypothetical protein
LSNAHEKALSMGESALAALRAGDLSHATSLWGTAEMRLGMQLDAVECLIVPVFRFVDPLCAHRIIHDNRRVRELAAECAHLFASAKPDAAAIFQALQALRTHSASERASMYRWADRHLDNSTRGVLWTRLVGA